MLEIWFKLGDQVTCHKFPIDHRIAFDEGRLVISDQQDRVLAWYNGSEVICAGGATEQAA